MRTRPWTIALLALSVLAVGCESESAKDGAAAEGKVTVQPRETIGKKTQNVLKLSDALQQGGVLAPTSITSTDYLGVQADAYRTSVAKIGAIQVEHTMRAYEALNGSMPATYEEFMSEIIKPGQPDGIQLAMLPYYQEYAYDEENKKLVVVEFPAKKEEVETREGIR